MSQVYYDPIVPGESNSPDTINSRLSDLDAATFANNANLNDRIDNIINENPGPSEVVDARTAINYKSGTPPSTLSDALEWAALDVANVLAFGATGDGVTNDTTAVQNAISNHFNIYFPPGIYKVAALTIADDRTLFSDGDAKILTDNGASYGIKVQGNRVTLRNLELYGSGVDDLCLLLDMNGRNIDQFRMQDCYVHDVLDVIRAIAVGSSHTLTNVTIDHCRFEVIENTVVGLSAYTGVAYTVEDFRFENCKIVDAAPNSSGKVPGGGGGFAGVINFGGLTAANRVHINNNIVLRAGPQFVSIANAIVACKDFVITGNTVRQDGTSTIVNMSYTLNNLTNLLFSDNSCYYVDYEHLYLRNVKSFKITNCHFENGNIGIAIVDKTAGERSYGEVTNCTFADIECPSTQNSGNEGIYIASDPAEVDISNCRFIKRTGTKAQVGIDIHYFNIGTAKFARVFSTTNYTWTLDAGGGGYYLRRTGNINPQISLPVNVYQDPISGTTTLTPGTIGSLAAGEWAYGDNNSLGYKTIYVHLTGGGAPTDNQVSAGYPRLGLNISHCTFERMSEAIDANSGGSISYFGHATITSCFFNSCSRGILFTNSVGCLVAYNRFRGCDLDVWAATEMQALRALYNVHFNTNPTNGAALGAYLIDVGTNFNIWEISSCTFRGVNNVHVLDAGANFSPRKRMLIFRDNDIDSLTTGVPSDISVITMINAAQKVIGAYSAAPSTGGDWQVGDTIWNSDPNNAGETLGWISTAAGASTGSHAMQAQAHYTQGAGAPSANATFIGQEYFQTTGHWWKAIATGSGASDWSALN